MAYWQYKNGSYYQGGSNPNTRVANGSGTLIYAKGDQFHAQFANGKPVGQGEISDRRGVDHIVTWLGGIVTERGVKGIRWRCMSHRPCGFRG